MVIEWNETKDEINRWKHGVSFVLASEIFLDPLIATVVDDRHAVDEMRFFSIGTTRTGRLLSVGHTDDSETVRLITARDSTPRAEAQYEESYG